MKNIKILHLFPNLLSLYGEYGNVAVLSRTLTDRGFSVSLDTWEDGPLNLAGYDFVYIGSGTEENLLEGIRRLLPHQEAVCTSINGETVWLATGNAMTLFGSTVEWKHTVCPALSAFPYSTSIHEKRYLGDAVTKDIFNRPMIGYVNTSCAYQGIETPFLEFRLGSGLGNDKHSSLDGIRSKNFFGTQLIGPVLVKNPHFLCQMVHQLTGISPEIAPESNIRKAYEVSLKELEKRIH